MAQKHTKNQTQIFSGLIKGNIGCSAAILVMVILTIIFAFSTINGNEDSFNAFAGTAMAFTIINLFCSIALIVLISYELAIAGEISGIKAQQFRIVFGILLGLYVLFLILSYVVNIFAFFQLVSIICILVFSCIYTKRLK